MTNDASPAVTDARIVVDRRFLWRVSFIAGLGGLLYGYDIGIIAAALVFVHKTFKPSESTESFVVSIFLVGSMLGSFCGGMIADRIGRRSTLLWWGTIFIAGSLLAALAPEVFSLMAARALLGVAIGFTSVTAPVFVSELAPPQSRGTLIGCYQLALVIGIAIANLVGYLLADAQAWRLMFGLGAAPAALFTLLVLVLPESPRWLCARGFYDRAEAVLETYTNPAGVAKLLKEIRSALLDRIETRWSALFTRGVRRSLFIGSGFLILLAVTGINAVIYFGPKIFSLAGVSNDKGAILLQLLITSLNVAATVVGLFFVDRVGRKPLLYAGVSGMTISLFLLAGAFARQDAFGPTLGPVVIGCLSLYITCYAFSMGPIAWILASEVFPLPIRGRGIAAASLSFSVANFLVAQTFLPLVNRAGSSATFGTYGFFCIVTLVFVRFVVPETKGIELESISKRPAEPAGFAVETNGS
jgi:sugar porter (SP) family MFS transporter